MADTAIFENILLLVTHNGFQDSRLHDHSCADGFFLLKGGILSVKQWIVCLDVLGCLTMFYGRELGGR